MLEENVGKWMDEMRRECISQGMAQGMAQGIEQGMAQGIEQGMAQGIDKMLEELRALGVDEAKLQAARQNASAGL